MLLLVVKFINGYTFVDSSTSTFVFSLYYDHRVDSIIIDGRGYEHIVLMSDVGDNQFQREMDWIVGQIHDTSDLRRVVREYTSRPNEDD